MKIAILNDSFFNEEHLKRLRKLGELVIYENTNSEEKAIQRLKDVDIAVVDGFLTNYNKKVLDSCSRLKMLALNSTAYTIVDLEAASKKRIKISNCPGFSKQAVAELTIALMFAIVRRIPQADQRFRRHAIDDMEPSSEEGREYIGFDLKDKTFGVIGLGKIGITVAEIANGIGMNVVAYNKTSKKIKNVKLASLKELLAESDVISINLALAPETKNIIGKKELALMKPSTVLINSARAELVDTDALYEALKNNKIRGAALDVVKASPNHPIFKLNNIIFTPHIGSYTEESFCKNLPDMIIQNIESFVKGKPKNIVN